MKKIKQSLLIVTLLSLASLCLAKEATNDLYILTLNLDGLVHYEGGILII